MPRFDTQGRIVSGTGSGVVAVDGEVISGGGVANWLAPGQVIFQNADDDRLYVYDVHTPQKPPVKLVEPNWGANALAANGGRWMAWLAGTGLYGPSGVIDASGRLAGVSQEQDGRGAASPDGYIAVTDNENQGFRIVGPSGEVTLEVPGTIALSMQVLDATTAVWVDEHRKPRAVGLPQPDVPSMGLFAIRAIEVKERWYVLAATNDGLILYPWEDASEGWKYDGNAFYPTAFVRDGGSLVSIAFATGAGETPESLRVWNVNVVTDPKVSLGAAPTPEPKMPDSLYEAVKAERAKYPAELTRDQPAKILNAVAWAHRDKGWGLSVKKFGNNVPSPQGVPVAYDILHHKPSDTLWGCFTDDMKATVNWGQEDHHHNPDRPWLAPVQPEDVTVPEPGPVEPGGPVAPGVKHAYWRDDNDRNECSVELTNGKQCDKPREDPIHAVAVPSPGPTTPPVEPQPEPEPQPGTGAPAWARQLMADVAAIRKHFV